MKKGYVYVMSNKTRTVLYIGVTSNLKDRIAQHRQGKGSEFTTKYRCRYLMYVEEYETIVEAIEREKQIKNWNRAWKLELIQKINPDLHDLWNDI